MVDVKRKMNEEIIRDLIILSKVPQGGKIRKGPDGTIDVEKRQSLVSIWRYLTGDSRIVSIQKVANIINRAFGKVDDLLLKKSLDIYLINKEPLPSEVQDHNEIVDFLMLLSQNLEEAVKGIENLKETYVEDVNSSAQLQIIADKVRRKVQCIKMKLDETHYRFIKRAEVITGPKQTQNR